MEMENFIFEFELNIFLLKEIVDSFLFFLIVDNLSIGNDWF